MGFLTYGVTAIRTHAHKSPRLTTHDALEVTDYGIPIRMTELQPACFRPGQCERSLTDLTLSDLQLVDSFRNGIRSRIALSLRSIPKYRMMSIGTTVYPTTEDGWHEIDRTFSNVASVRNF